MSNCLLNVAFIACVILVVLSSQHKIVVDIKMQLHLPPFRYCISALSITWALCNLLLWLLSWINLNTFWHRSENFDTSTASGACDKYQVWLPGADNDIISNVIISTVIISTVIISNVIISNVIIFQLRILTGPKGLREPEATLEPRVHECVQHSSELYCSHVTYIGVTLSPLG